MRSRVFVFVAMRLLAIAAAVFVALMVVAPRVRAQAAVATPVALPLAARDLARGVTLTRDDIDTDSSSTASATRLVGWGTRRLVRKGEPLREPAVAPPVLVTAGSSVTVRATVGGVTVTREGTATSAGALGERIRVRLDTQHSITGTVAGPATVHLP